MQRVDRKLKHALSSSGCAAGDDESSSSTESSAGETGDDNLHGCYAFVQSVQCSRYDFLVSTVEQV